MIFMTAEDENNSRYQLSIALLSACISISGCDGDKKTIVIGTEDMVARQEIAALAGEISDLQTELNVIKAQLDNQETKIVSLESENETDSARLSSLEADVQSILIRKTPVLVDANGQTLGSFISVNIQGEDFFSLKAYSLGMTPGGQLFRIAADGEMQPINVLFSGTDCTGQAYVQEFALDPVNPAFLQGAIYHTYNTAPSTFYYSKQSEPVVAGVVANSYAGNTGCTNFVSTPTDLYRVYPNDTSVTGMPNTYAGPIRAIGYGD